MGEVAQAILNAVDEATRPRPRQRGTAILTCRNHPTYRWTKTKYGPGFIGAGTLMFEGDLEGKPANPVQVLSERSLAMRGGEFERHYREHYTPECDCPALDLVFVGWAD